MTSFGGKLGVLGATMLLGVYWGVMGASLKWGVVWDLWREEEVYTGTFLNTFGC